MTYKIFLSLFFGILLTGSCSKKEKPGVGSTDATVAIKYIDTLPPSTPMKHTGGLHTATDFDHIKTNIAGGTEPWLGGWNKLIANSHAQTTYVANPTVKLIRGGSGAEEPEPDPDRNEQSAP